jgi:OmpA family protein/outer membrane protein with beta-barrel domain/thrombospondin type 3 repeat protein
VHPRSPALLLAALTLAGPVPLVAQRLYRLEAGVAGGYSSFDKDGLLKPGFGMGLRLGYFVWGPLSIEAQGDLTPTHTDTPLHRSISVKTLGGYGVLNIPLNYSSAFLLKAGFGWVQYGGACPSTVSIPGYGICGSTSAALGGAGVRIGLSPTLMMRYEGNVSYSQQAGAKLLNFGLQGGVSVMIGSTPLTDADRDRVYDRYDACPGTRLGALVDRRGCPTDQDGDKVPDGLDRCPNTPPGAMVDPVGCTTDTDGDGILDGLDRCPDTPKGAVINSQGCPIDTDGDGVYDGLDRCPGTAAGVKVDGLGCPADADGDGVADGVDKCPNTRPGEQVDADGCPVVAPPAGRDSTTGARVWVIPGTAFPYRSPILGEAAFPILDSVVTTMMADPATVAEVNGFAHDRLVPGDNTRLSQRRAEAIRSYLLQHGVPVTRVSANGLGSSILIVADTTEAARTANRRAEIKVRHPPR